MLATLLTLVLVAVDDPRQAPPATFKVEMPRLSNGPAPIQSLYPSSPRTIQVEPAAPPNPFLGRRTGDFATVRRPGSLPPTTSTAARIPDILGHTIELFDQQYMRPLITQDREAAITAEALRLPVGRFEPRHVWEYDFRSGYPRPDNTVIITDPKHDNLIPAGFRRSEMTPTVTVGRWPTSSLLSGDKLVEARIAKDVAAMKQLAARQAEYDRRKLAYDRVRSLWTPDGPDAASFARDFAPQVAPSAILGTKRGVQVYPAPIGPMPRQATSPPPMGWHPPMSLPKSTPLP